MTMRERAAAGAERAGRELRAMILLGGWVRPTELSKAAGMNLLDLPISQERTLLAQWAEEAGALAKAWGVERLALRILLDQAAALPTAPAAPAEVALSLEHDPTGFRGTAGVLRDACAGYADDDLVLVANANQILFSPLTRLATCLASLGAGAAMAAHRDGTPATLMLLRCGCLRGLPEIGYLDMKEQALPIIGRRFSIKAAQFSDLVCRGVRTRESYVSALGAIHGQRNAAPLAEHWRSDFEIRQAGATVAPGVRLHNSVILRGATVGRDAVLVRCVACPGAVVPAGAVLVDRLISAEGIVGTEEAVA